MPRLGEPVEPSRAERVDPWWRPVATEKADDEAVEENEPPSLPPQAEGVPWPMD
jgi:hypothetical protein